MRFLYALLNNAKFRKTVQNRRAWFTHVCLAEKHINSSLFVFLTVTWFWYISRERCHCY
jgi:hypothetical protein